MGNELHITQRFEADGFEMEGRLHADDERFRAEIWAAMEQHYTHAEGEAMRAKLEGMVN